MDELAHLKFDQTVENSSRAKALSHLRVLGAGRWHAPVRGRPAARFVAVRGRSGVGKSTVAANLAIALAGLRSRVVLIDLDLHHPTQHELFGIASPVAGLKALLHEQIDTMEQALTPTSVRGLHLVSAEGTLLGPTPTFGNGAAEVEQQHRLLSQIWDLDADVVIADVGTHGGNLVDLFDLGALRLVVTAPDPPSIRRAYNFFKDEVAREIDHVAGGIREGNALLAALFGERPGPMAKLLDGIDARPNIRAALEQALGGFGGRLVGNRIRNPDEADLIHASSRLIADYLGVAVPVLGVLDSTLQMGETRVSGRPLLLGSGIDRNVRLFHAMAEQLLMDDTEFEAPRCVPRAVAPGEATPAPLLVRAEARDPDGDPLPTSLGGYMRRHPRHPVDWHGCYVSQSGREIDVRVLEVSLSSASIETLPALDVGDHGRLVLPQIAGKPEIPVTVLDARRPLGRAGLRFDGAESVCAQLAAMAAKARF